MAKLGKYVERIQALEEEKQTLSNDIKEIYEEVEEAGFDVKALRLALRLRKLDAGTRDKAERYEGEVWGSIARDIAEVAKDLRDTLKREGAEVHAV